jgi:hypothetical protein
VRCIIFPVFEVKKQKTAITGGLLKIGLFFYLADNRSSTATGPE